MSLESIIWLSGSAIFALGVVFGRMVPSPATDRRGVHAGSELLVGVAAGIAVCALGVIALYR